MMPALLILLIYAACEHQNLFMRYANLEQFVCSAISSDLIN